MPLDVYFPPGYGQFALKFKCDDTTTNAYCTMAFKNDAGLTAQEADEALRDEWLTTGRPGGTEIRNDQWRFMGTYTLLQHSGFQTSFTFDANIVGTVAVASPQASVSIVVNKRTPNAGKRYRGRFAWPPFLVAETEVDAGGFIASGAVTSLNGGFAAALNGMQAADLPMVLLHTRNTVDELPTPTVVTSLGVNPLMGIQRRRGGR